MGSVFKPKGLAPYKPRPFYVPKTTKHELPLQQSLCNYMRRKYPGLVFVSDYSSGLRLTANQAKINKSLQSSRGMPDLQIVKPSREYFGMFLEIKKSGTAIYLSRGSNKGQLVANEHIREQALMLEQLNKLGYFARFGVGYDNCVRLIDWYLNPDYKQLDNTELF